jgi:hypothetical protein
MRIEPLTLETAIGHDATGARVPVLQIQLPAGAPPTLALVTLQLAVELGRFLGDDTPWAPAVDLGRGAIALEPTAPSAVGADGVARLAAFIAAIAARRAPVLA